MLKVAGGNKDEGANTQGLCAPTETMDASWEELSSDDPDPVGPHLVGDLGYVRGQELV